MPAISDPGAAPPRRVVRDPGHGESFTPWRTRTALTDPHHGPDPDGWLHVPVPR